MVSPSTFLGRIVGSEIILNFGVPFSRGAGKKVTTSKIHCFFNFDMGRKGILDIVDNVSIGRLSRDMVRSLSYIVKAQVFKKTTYKRCVQHPNCRRSPDIHKLSYHRATNGPPSLFLDGCKEKDPYCKFPQLHPSKNVGR